MSNETARRDLGRNRAGRHRLVLMPAILALCTATAGAVDCREDLWISFDYSADDLTVRFSPRTDERQTVESTRWSFGDGASSGERAPVHTYDDHGSYAVTLTVEVIVSPTSPPQTCTVTATKVITFVRADRCCENSFALDPDSRYVLGAWTKENLPPEDLPGTVSYPNPSIRLVFKIGGAFVESDANPFLPAGNVIDGWQRIEKDFRVPQGASELRIELENQGPNDVFFDDVRIFPTKGNMKSFVYDPLSLRLMAELDERNYATFYEYDQEGALIRVKKETERGIMTIQESRNATHKTD